MHKHTIAVGAPEASVPPAPDGVGPGTAYVFTGSGATWTQKSELYDPEEVAADNGDSFGYEVAVSTTGTVVCNAPGDPQGYESDDSIGAAFVFASDRGTWPTSSPTELTAADGADGDYFGYGLATLKGNYIIVGSPFLARRRCLLLQVVRARDLVALRRLRGPVSPRRAWDTSNGDEGAVRRSRSQLRLG